MNNIHNKMEEIKKEFSIFEDERDKYIYVVDIAKKSPGINPLERNDENKVYVGNIFYNQGLATITNENYLCFAATEPVAKNNYYDILNVQKVKEKLKNILKKFKKKLKNSKEIFG